MAPGELQATSTVLSQIADEARSALQSLGIDASSLLDGAWRGQAATAFGHGWSQWHTGAVEVLDALDAMARLLGATGQGYDVAEGDSVSALSQVNR